MARAKGALGGGRLGRVVSRGGELGDLQGGEEMQGGQSVAGPELEHMVAGEGDAKDVKGFGMGSEGGMQGNGVG